MDSCLPSLTTFQFDAWTQELGLNDTDFNALLNPNNCYLNQAEDQLTGFDAELHAQLPDLVHQTQVNPCSCNLDQLNTILFSNQNMMSNPQLAACSSLSNSSISDFTQGSLNHVISRDNHMFNEAASTVENSDELFITESLDIFDLVEQRKSSSCNYAAGLDSIDLQTVNNSQILQQKLQSNFPRQVNPAQQRSNNSGSVSIKSKRSIAKNINLTQKQDKINDSALNVNKSIAPAQRLPLQQVINPNFPSTNQHQRLPLSTISNNKRRISSTSGSKDASQRPAKQPNLGTIKPGNRYNNNQSSLIITHEQDENGAIQTQSNSRVRARRGEATDSHSISERKRRIRITETMQAMHSLVPNGTKTNKVAMLDETITYVTQLQNEFEECTRKFDQMINYGVNQSMDADQEVNYTDQEKLMMMLMGTKPIINNSKASAISTNTGTRSQSRYIEKVLDPLEEQLAEVERHVIHLLDRDPGAALRFLSSHGLSVVASSDAMATLSQSTQEPAVPAQTIQNIANDIEYDSMGYINSSEAAAVLPALNSDPANCYGLIEKFIGGNYSSFAN